MKIFYCIVVLNRQKEIIQNHENFCVWELNEKLILLHRIELPESLSFVAKHMNSE